MKTLRLARLALIAITISCGSAADSVHQIAGPEQQPSVPGNLRTDLQAARDRWQAQKLHTYAFTLQRSCFCVNVHPLYVVVLADTVAVVLDLETAQPVDVRLGQTVDGLFTFIQNAIDQKAVLLRAQYDATKGFPAQIDYDCATQIADDELFLRASDVHPIFPTL